MYDVVLWLAWLAVDAVIFYFCWEVLDDPKDPTWMKALAVIAMTAIALTYLVEFVKFATHVNAHFYTWLSGVIL